jgi:hypothetical protein
MLALGGLPLMCALAGEPEPPPPAPEPSAAPQPAPAPPPDPKNRSMLIAGNVLVAAGVGGVVLMTVGFVIASDARDRLSYALAHDPPDEGDVARHQRRVEVGDRIGISGAAAAGALLVTGITLTAVAYARERKRRAAVPSQAVGPWLGREMAGFCWTGRF